LARVDVLDVGHGCCAVLTDGDGCVVVDAGTGQVLLQYLRQHDINVIDAALVSHGDMDHLGGLIDVLLDSSISVRHIYLNPDALRRTRCWEVFRVAAREAMESGRTVIHAELTTTTTSEQLARQSTRISILAPDPITALAGIGGQGLEGEAVTAHSMSAVIKVSAPHGLEVLIAGDVDSNALHDLLAHPDELPAAVLVFPHHGGLAEGHDVVDFASQLCAAVIPKLVVFSTGRDTHRNPRPEVVHAVRMAVPTAHIACTQLSKDCAANVPPQEPTHLSQTISRGMASKKCCAGSIRIELGSMQFTCIPSLEHHAEFVQSFASTALCRDGAG
jgi:competence protein ComEC